MRCLGSPLLATAIWCGCLGLLSCQRSTPEDKITQPSPDVHSEAQVEARQADIQAEQAEQSQLQFQQAVEKQDLARLEKWLKSGADPSLVDANGNTPLTLAAGAGWKEAVIFLLDQGARLDQEVPLENQSALAWALAHHWQCLTGRLLTAGARPDQALLTPADESFISKVNAPAFAYYLRKEKGVTPLMLAAATGQDEALLTLLEAGADRRAKTHKHQTTAIWLAGRGHHVRSMQILLGLKEDKAPSARIEVSLKKQSLALLKNEEVIFQSPISSGAKGYETPPGKYVVTNKHREWFSTLYDDAPMPFFLRLSCGAIGFHAGNLPGYPASHGCIRLPYENAKALFGRVNVGTEVVIHP